MLTTRFGLKLDAASDKITNAGGSSSLPFETQQYRVGLQGVVNAGRIMGFDEFTKTIGLLVHAGVQVGTLTPKTGANKDVTEKNGGIMFGITPQVKLSNHLALTADFTVLSNVRQHFAWDGSYSAESNNLNGQMYNTSLGLTYFFGKKEKHADWMVPVKEDANLSDLNKRIDDVEKLMNDGDHDGIADSLDLQKNTPAGLAVDSKGRFYDVNKNGIADELEPNKGTSQTIVNNNSTVSNSDALKSLVETGSVNVFFDVNQDVPNSGSTNSVYEIYQYLVRYPSSKINLVGYADVRGDEKANKDLSKRRSENIRKLLIDTGINSNRIETSYEGVDKKYPASTIGLDLARRVSVQVK
jgi:OOP family OmpA-OmpF porin